MKLESILNKKKLNYYNRLVINRAVKELLQEGGVGQAWRLNQLAVPLKTANFLLCLKKALQKGSVVTVKEIFGKRNDLNDGNPLSQALQALICNRVLENFEDVTPICGKYGRIEYKYLGQSLNQALPMEDAVTVELSSTKQVSLKCPWIPREILNRWDSLPQNVKEHWMELPPADRLDVSYGSSSRAECIKNLFFSNFHGKGSHK
jgi:hypothetical protein